MTLQLPDVRTVAVCARAAACALPLSLAGFGCSSHSADSYQGYVEGEFVYMASSQAGQLTDLSVARGTSVAAGDQLFALEAQNETDGVAQARHQLQVATAQHSDMLTGKRPPEVEVIEAQLAQARADATRAQTQLKRDQEQYQAGGIPKSQLDDSQATALSTAAHVRELQAQLDVARLPGRGEQIRAEGAQVRAAQAALAQAQWKLDQKTVRAAQTGLVYDTMYRRGEWVPAGSPVVRMLPPENVKVRFFVPERAVGAITAGRPLQIHCDGCAQDIPAKITFVSEQAEYTPPVIYSNEARSKLVFLVEARPQPDDASKLHPGQPVEVMLR